MENFVGSEYLFSRTSSEFVVGEAREAVLPSTQDSFQEVLP